MKNKKIVAVVSVSPEQPARRHTPRTIANAKTEAKSLFIKFLLIKKFFIPGRLKKAPQGGLNVL